METMKEIEYLIKKHGGKAAVAELLEITVRYVNMLLSGRKPGRQLAKIIRMYAPKWLSKYAEITDAAGMEPPMRFCGLIILLSQGGRYGAALDASKSITFLMLAMSPIVGKW